MLGGDKRTPCEADKRARGLACPQSDLTCADCAPREDTGYRIELRGHIEEAKAAGVKIPTEQVWFCKQPTSVNSPFGGIHKPIVSGQLDYEVELVAVIGKKGRRIPAGGARDTV